MQDSKPTPQYFAAIAARYIAARHSPRHPSTAGAYAAFVDETRCQYFTVERLVAVTFTDTDPYPDSAAMLADLDCGRLRTYTGGSMPADHPLAALAPIGETFNSLFRAVHDYYGHYGGFGSIHPRYGFGPLGEYRAWQRHRTMYGPLARLALAAETIGQSSYVFYGPHIARPEGTFPAATDPDFLPFNARPFAEQKATALDVQPFQLGG